MRLAGIFAWSRLVCLVVHLHEGQEGSVSLWDHISRRQREKMAGMLRPPDGIGPQFHTFSIAVVKDIEIWEIQSQRRLPSLAPIKDMIDGVSGDSVKRLKIIISPTEGVEALYITDIDETRSYKVPKDIWEQVRAELGLDGDESRLNALPRAEALVRHPPPPWNGFLSGSHPET